MNASAVVTGGAGFLGSHLCDRLVAEGYTVTCVDNLLTGSLANVQHLAGHPRFRFIQHDITEPFEAPGVVHFVLNLASPASPKDYARHPIGTLKVGALGTYQALEAARARGAAFVLASTSEVYGDPAISPQPESYWGHVNPVGPRSVYDEAKRYAEALTMAYHRVHGMDVRIARIFNTYGPRMRMDDGRVLPEFMARALRGMPLAVQGDGSQTRSFCYVSDMVEGLYTLMTAPWDALVGNGQLPIVNLGSPEEITILQLAQEVIELTGSRSPLVFRPLPEDDPKTRRPDISRAKRLLGWAPKVSRRQGLQMTLEHFRSAVAASPAG